MDQCPAAPSIQDAARSLDQHPNHPPLGVKIQLHVEQYDVNHKLQDQKHRKNNESAGS